MTVINIKEYNTECYGISFESNGWIKVQKYEDISNHENNIFCAQPFR